MFTRKINYIWAINLLLFIAVVFLGIEQAGKGAEISKLEDKLENITVSRRDLTDKIFSYGSDDKLSNYSELGFAKPSKVLYFNSIDAVASR